MSSKEPNLKASADHRSSGKPSGHKSSSKVRASRDSHQSSRSSGGKSSGIRSSRTGAHSGSKKAYGSEASGSHRMIVRDEDGNDVTPLSLLASSDSKSKSKSKDGGGSDAGSTAGSGTVSPHSESFSEDGHSRSGRSSGTTTPGYTEDEASADGALVAQEEAAKPEESSRPAHSGAPVEIVTTDVLPAADVHHTHLIETATITLFSLKAQRVSDESPDFEMCKAANATYDQALKDRIGNDSFVPRGTQTLNPLMKTKDTNTMHTHMRDSICDSAGMDIADMVSRAANASQTDFVDFRSKGKKSRSIASGKDLPVKEVLESVLLLERLITQNMYHDRHMLYRDMAKPETSDVLPSKRLDPLWTYKCDLTVGRTVSGMCWNEVQRDVLAVSFCQFEFSKQKGGLIVFWSLRTPAYPEKYIETPSGVTAVAFSKKSPQLLAAGCHDGTLLVYDISRPENPFVKSTYEDGKHSDAIWDLQWVDRGAERGEMLVSSSTDGRVTMWSVKKGLEHSDLIKLKRVASKLGAGDVFISRNASATALDFASFDPNIYIVATEDGHIHKCSCSYNEQYLETYSGHQGPVYRIRWAPYHPQVFMSCSADWSVRIWHCDTTVPLLTTQPCTEPVMDIAWSPRLSTVFATATRDGTIAVWNILHSLLDPIASVKLDKAPTRVLFGHIECPVLLAGDEDGVVHVFRLVNLDDSGIGMSPEEQRKKIDAAFATKESDSAAPAPAH